MRAMTLFTLVLIAIASSAAHSSSGEGTSYLLKPRLAQGDIASISLDLEVGGDMLFRTETEIKRLPLSVAGRLNYQQRIIAWSADPAEVTRSLRNYQTASATIQVDEKGCSPKLGNPERFPLNCPPQAGR